MKEQKRAYGKRTVDKITARCKSRRGETITETLVALLISSLALLMLAGAISSAARVITRSKDKIGKYYAADEQMANQTAAGVSITVSMKDISEGDEKLPDLTFHGRCYTNNEFSGTAVVSYVTEDSSPETGDEGS